MGSPITLSGFNNIDFNVILNAVMLQESAPLNALTAQQTNLRYKDSQYKVLGTKLSALDSAALSLGSAASITTYAATTSDSNVVAVSTTSGAVAGHYDVKVTTLARAQVTASASTVADGNTTIVATGGSITIGGKQVDISSGVTLQGLADAINSKSGITVSASVIQSAPGAYKLVLTGLNTGLANAFTLTNALTGGTGITFTDGNSNGITGDQAGDNAVQAVDASITVNNIGVISSTNTLTSVVPGVTLTLKSEAPAQTVAIDVAQDNADLITRVKAFATAYNDVVNYANAQTAADRNKQGGNLARDPALTGVRTQLRAALLAAYGAGTYTHLAEVGIEVDQTGQLTVDESALNGALSSNASDVAMLFTGTNSDGAFAAIHTLVTDYNGTGGFVSTADQAVMGQLSRLQDQIAQTTARLAQRRAALQAEFIAADQAMSRLNQQLGSLKGLGISN